MAIDDGFPGARRGSCEVLADDHVRLAIVPEDDGVSNPSPWYAFRVVPTTAGTARIELDYGSWRHRYIPKLSSDGKTWGPLPASDVTVSDDGSKAVLDVRLGTAPLWLSAQELVTAQDVPGWSHAIAQHPGVHLDVLGESAERQPVYLLRSDGDTGLVALFVGRQHPPEVSGAIAMRTYLETVFADTALAREFRERIGVRAIPMLNPDGVDRGNWRHNSGATDLNRDWGPFAQPETQLVQALLERLDAAGSKLLVFVDFHSTNRNLFYTQPESDPTVPAHFTQALMARARARLPDYDFSNEPRAQSTNTTAKNYLYGRYGIPSMTYEVADEADRNLAMQAAVVFAEEAMRLLLEYVRHPESTTGGRQAVANAD